MSICNYNPIPPRVWSRVQNPCTYTVLGSDYTQSFIPLTGQTVSQEQADYDTKQIYKGNILQYKGNSARLTKSQKYSQLARCAGPNRTKVFATQSETYTNPNTTGLLRVGFETYPFPNQIVGAPNNISGPFEYNIRNPNDCSGNSVQDGGTLVCGTYANPCTGEIVKQGISSATICNPASASDVPGFSVLCWNNKVQTWFPKPRYVMNNSTDKWPQGYKGFVSAIKPVIPTAPVLYLNYYKKYTDNLENKEFYIESMKSKDTNSTKYDTNSTKYNIHFYWKSNHIFKADSFNIYVNNNLYKTIKNDNNFAHVINNHVENNCIISITSILNNIESKMSNYIYFNDVTPSQSQPIDPSNCCCNDLSNCCCHDLSNCCCDLTDVNNLLTIIDEKINNINSNINNKIDNVNSKIEEFKLDINTNFSDLELSYNLLDQNINIKTENINNNVNSKMDNVNSKMDNVNSKIEEFKLDMNTNFSDLELSYNLLDQNINIKTENINNKIDNVNSKMDNVNSKIEEFKLDINTNFSDVNNLLTIIDQNINIKTENINNNVNSKIASVNSKIDNKISNVNSKINNVISKIEELKLDNYTNFSDLELIFKNGHCSCCSTDLSGNSTDLSGNSIVPGVVPDGGRVANSICNCVFYKSLFRSSIITKINNYVSTYIETIYQDTHTYIPIDVFNDLNIELNSLENLFLSDPSCCFFNIIDIHRNMLKLVKTSYDNKNLANSTLMNAESWKNDSRILNDRDNLNEYIQNLSKNFFVTSVNITSAYANLKTQYQIYIQLYGLPENLEFDIDKLSSILKEIGDYYGNWRLLRKLEIIKEVGDY